MGLFVGRRRIGARRAGVCGQAFRGWGRVPLEWWEGGGGWKVGEVRRRGLRLLLCLGVVVFVDTYDNVLCRVIGSHQGSEIRVFRRR